MKPTSNNYKRTQGASPRRLRYAKHAGDGQSGVDIVISEETVQTKSHAQNSNVSTANRPQCSCAICLLSLALCIAILAIIGMSSVHDRAKHEQKLAQDKHDTARKKTCTSPRCLRYSAGLLLNMNLTELPCSNFEEFACGGYRARAILGPQLAALDSNGEENRRTALNDMTIVLRDRLHQALYYQSLPVNGSKSETWRTAAGQLYKSCYEFNANTSTFFTASYHRKSLQRALEQVLPWAKQTQFMPWLLGRQKYNKKCCPNNVKLQHRLIETLSGLNTALDLQMDMSQKSNAVLNIFHFPEISVIQRNDFQPLLMWSFQLLGISKERVPNEELKELNQLLPDSNSSKNITLVKKKINGTLALHELCHETSTEKQLKRLSVCQNSFLNNVTVNLMTSNNSMSKQNISISLLSYQLLTLVTAMLRLQDALPIELINNAAIEKQTKEIVEQYSQLSIIFQQNNEVNQWMKSNSNKKQFVSEHCLSFQRALLPYLTTFRYMEIKDVEELRGEATAIFKEIKDELKKILQNDIKIDWHTKEALVDHVDTVKIDIGHPQWMNNVTILQMTYKNILPQIIGDEFLSNLVNLLSVRRKLLLTNVGVNSAFWLQLPSGNVIDEPFNTMSHWAGNGGNNEAFYPLAVDSKYVHEFRSVLLPIGFLSPPVIDVGLPECIRYGATGGVLGHELVQSLRVVAYDQENKHKTCITQQPINYWNQISDLIGVRLALKAFSKRLVIMKEQKETQDFLHSFTHIHPKEMFFVSWAQLLCSKEINRDKDITNTLSPTPSQRINQLISTIPEFKEIFSCSVDQIKVQTNQNQSLLKESECMQQLGREENDQSKESSTLHEEFCVTMRCCQDNS